MRNVDLTHLWRSAVGFDRLLDLIEDQIRWTDEDNYPPYDVERVGENQYQISLALAGFTPEEITVTAEQDLLTVQGRKSEKGNHEYLYQGISARPFRRVFNLADFVKVENATFANGLLKIELVREIPDAMKSRRIAINTGSLQIPHSKAA